MSTLFSFEPRPPRPCGQGLPGLASGDRSRSRVSAPHAIRPSPLSEAGGPLPQGSGRRRTDLRYELLDRQPRLRHQGTERAHDGRGLRPGQRRLRRCQLRLRGTTALAARRSSRAASARRPNNGHKGWPADYRRSCPAHLGCFEQVVPRTPRLLRASGRTTCTNSAQAWASFAFACATFFPIMHGGRIAEARPHCR